MVDISRFIDESKRVLMVSKKPSSKEYWTMARATGLGIIVIAAVGFVVFLIKALFFSTM